MDPIHVWNHYNEAGQVIGEIRRFVHRDGKSKEDIPCYRSNADGFSPGIPDDLKINGYPLFGLNSIRDRNKIVYIVEGQKVQSALAGLGFQSVTSILGARSAHCSDWQGLNGCVTVLTLPDNDPAGEIYAKSVFGLVHALPTHPKTYTAQLPDLPDGGDACDWLKQQPELADWDELKSLATHPDRVVIYNRLIGIIKENTLEIPNSRTGIQHDNSNWPTPKPISTESLLPVAPLPESIIPEPFRHWISDVAHRMQCPIDFVAIPAIVVAGSVIGAACGIKPKQYDDWLVVPNLWGGVVGRPGKLKSPAIAEPLRILEHLADKAKLVFDSANQRAFADMAAHEAKKNALKDEMSAIFKGKAKRSIEFVKSELAAMGASEKPTWRRYKTNDATIEKMSVLLSDNPRGLLLFRDELIGLLASWDKDGHESDRAFFLEAWNGYGTIDTDRIGRGTTHTENLCVSVLGGIQPAKLAGYLFQSVRGYDNDGLLQRLQMLVYPDDRDDWRLIDQYPNTKAKQRVVEIIERLSEANFITYGAITDAGAKVPHIRFTNEAQDLFYDWLTDLEQRRLKSDDEPIILEHLSKYRSLMPSLALIFHLIEVVDGKANGDITLHAAEMAAAWCDYLESHARRIYGLVGNLAGQATAKLAKKLKEGALEDGFTVRDVYRKEWGQLTDRDVTQSACDDLAEAGWLREEVVRPAPGQRGKICYHINPKIRGRDE